jgi:hypothetical protein
MKKTYLFYAISFLGLAGLILFAGFTVSRQNDHSKMTDNKNYTSDHHEKKLRHVVLFKFKEGTAQKDIVRVEKAFKELQAKIPQIRDFEWGLNNSPEGLDKGFTHCFFLTFESEEDRSIYLPHSDHKAFGKLLGPFLEDVLVVDYWIKE